MNIPYRPLTPYRKITPSIALQILFGIFIGLLLGLCMNYEVESDVQMHIRTMSHRSVHDPNKLFYLRCVVMLTPGLKKPEQFMKSVKDGWGSMCNQTFFYTNDLKLYKRSKDPFIIHVDVRDDGYSWEFYRSVLEHANRMPALWTLVSDEQLFVVVNNLRKILLELNDEQPVMIGRVTQSNSVLSWLFPSAYGNRINHQAGVVMSQQAVQAMITCTGYFYLCSSEKALIECAKAMKVTVIDPVDEEGQHLFHSKGMMSLIPDSLSNRSVNIEEAEGVAGCCSDHSITFASTSYKEMRVAYYITQKMAVFGSNGVETYTTTTTMKTTSKAMKRPQKSKPGAKKSEKKVEKLKNNTKTLKSNVTISV